MKRALPLLAFAFVACRPPPSQVLIIVDAQPAVRLATQGLTVHIWGGDHDAQLPDVAVHDLTSPIGRDQWPRRFAVTPESGDASRLYRFEAIARRTPAPDGEVVATARVISGYQAGETLQIHLMLYDACIDVDCTNPRETCDPATRGCRDAVKDPGELMLFMPEAGVPDSGVAPRECSADADCADEHDCTEDRCIEGRCSRTYVDSACDDGVACTSGRCTDEGCMHDPDDAMCDDGLACTADACMGVGCTHEPDDELCTGGTGGRCDAVNGCQYDTCDASTCTAGDGACATATCQGAMCVRTSCSGTECCNADTGACEPLDDANPCTDDMCGTDHVEHTPKGGTCHDGDLCTVGDYCSGGSCVSGAGCDSGSSPCTVGSCDPVMGCESTNVADGTGCGSAGSCGVCMDGTCVEMGCPPGDAGVRDAGLDAGACGGACDAAHCCNGACCGSNQYCDRGAAPPTCRDRDAGVGPGCGASSCSNPMDICCDGACVDQTMGDCCDDGMYCAYAAGLRCDRDRGTCVNVDAGSFVPDAGSVSHPDGGVPYFDASTFAPEAGMSYPDAGIFWPEAGAVP